MGLLDAPAKLRGTDYRRINEGFLDLPVVGGCHTARNLSGGTVQTASYQMKHIARINCRDLRFFYSNFTSNPNETSGNAAITIKASVVTSDGTPQAIPMTFGGATSVTLGINASTLSDPVRVDLVAGGFVYVVTYITVVTLGDKWPQTKYGSGSDNEGVHNGSDDTGSSTGITTGITNGYIYGPNAMLGTPNTTATLTRTLLDGDSLTRGAMSGNPFSETGGLNLTGPLSRNIVHNIAQYGDTTANANKTNAQVLRGAWADGCTQVITWYGNNDCNINGKTLAQLQADLLLRWGRWSRRGLRTYQPTITPRTTSTDSWATVGNQTVAASPWSDTLRQSVNTWLRAGAPIDPTTKAAVAIGTTGALTCDVYDVTATKVLTGTGRHYLSAVFEWADAVESSRNSGKWIAGTATSDGVHPSGVTQYALISAATPWSLLGIS